MDLVPAVREPAQLWVPFYVRLEIVKGIVRYLLKRRKPKASHVVSHQQLSPHRLLDGAHPSAMSGGIEVAVTTPFVGKKGQEHAGG